MKVAKHSSDLEIARRILIGEETALRYFYETHFDRVFQFVLNRVGGDVHETEEVVQETFLASLRALKRYDGKSTLFSWLCSIARHNMVNSCRRQMRRSKREIPFSLLDVSWDSMAAGGSPEHEPSIHDLLVARTMRELPEHYRFVLTQKYVENRTTRDIAKERGATAKAVESLLSRARKAFREASDRLT